ncbi:MAG: hypothetical protein J6A63_05545 [Clostridia bacterium]|nr:hypothetical protein [Clostridia bacterium]
MKICKYVLLMLLLCCTAFVCACNGAETSIPGGASSSVSSVSESVEDQSEESTSKEENSVEESSSVEDGTSQEESSEEDVYAPNV